jgi:phosphoribosylformylglycinamidine synthase
VGATPPDLDDPELMKSFFAAIQELEGRGILLAYHDRSDGGLMVTLLEMAFAAGAGLSIELTTIPGDPIPILFNEELGAVVQVRAADVDRTVGLLANYGLGEYVHAIGTPTRGHRVVIRRRGRTLLEESRATLRAVWSETTHRMQALRDDPTCADQEQALRTNPDDPGIDARVPFDPNADVAAPLIATGARPRVAVLREQGVNGHVEMAAAWTRAGFDAIDVHMSDLIAGLSTLDGFNALAVCGGFSYGDVLGAGGGWAKSILWNARARDEFQRFFERGDTLALGVCNGAQMLSHLRGLIPGASDWPRFLRNRSEQFEARLSMVQIEETPSLLFSGMEGARLPVVVSHGEGRVEFENDAQRERVERGRLVPARYVDNQGQVTEHYPENPNGSPAGITALTTPDGRATILMPHPERVFRAVQFSFRPRNFEGDSPWMRLFRNARVWLD